MVFSGIALAQQLLAQPRALHANVGDGVDLEEGAAGQRADGEDLGRSRPVTRDDFAPTLAWDREANAAGYPVPL